MSRCTGLLVVHSQASSRASEQVHGAVVLVHARGLSSTVASVILTDLGMRESSKVQSRLTQVLMNCVKSSTVSTSLMLAGQCMKGVDTMMPSSWEYVTASCGR